MDETWNVWINEHRHTICSTFQIHRFRLLATITNIFIAPVKHLILYSHSLSVWILSRSNAKIITLNPSMVKALQMPLYASIRIIGLRALTRMKVLQTIYVSFYTLKCKAIWSMYPICIHIPLFAYLHAYIWISSRCFCCDIVFWSPPHLPALIEYWFRWTIIITITKQNRWYNYNKTHNDRNFNTEHRLY